MRIGVMLLSCMLADAALATQGPPPVLNPKWYSSPSGEYRLHVDPSSLHGEGEGSYRLMRGDAEVWSARHPFTLWEAGVTDDGTVAGYAYTLGERGFRRKYGEELKDQFHVVILDAAGGIRLNDVTSRTRSRFLNTPPAPFALGMLVHPETDRFIVRLSDPVAGRGNEEWRIHRLSTGETLSAYHPTQLIDDPKVLRWSVQLCAVRGTPLTLVQWWRVDSKKTPHAVGTRFDLLKEDGQSVWTLELPNDYTAPLDTREGWALQNAIRKRGAILSTDEPNRFDLHLVAAGERVTFSVDRDDAAPLGWRVERIGSRAIDPPGAPPPPEPPDAVEISLKHLGDLELGGAEPPPVVRNVMDFDIDDQGRIGFIRRPDGGGPAMLVLMSPSQEVVREVQVIGNGDKVGLKLDLAWAGGDQWAVAEQIIDQEPGTMEAIWLIRTSLFDLGTGTHRPVVELCEGRLTSLKKNPGGGFGALVSQHVPRTSQTRIAIFNENGAPSYDTAASGFENGRAFEFALTSNNHIARLDPALKRMSMHDLNDHLVKFFNLKACWGWEPNYPSNVYADVDGGVVVHDFEGNPSIIRMRSDGTVAASFDARFGDGRVITPYKGIVVAPDRSLWVSDGEAILRLGEDGVVTQTLGARPDDVTLRSIDELCVDGAGSIHVLDRRGGRIHVFDGQGAPQRTLGPEGNEFETGIAFSNLSVAHDGTLHLAIDRGLPTRDILRFAPTGTRLTPVHLDIDSSSVTWLHKPHQPGGWVLSYNDVHLVDVDGASKRRISRRPDGKFLEQVGFGAVAPDGSVAVAASPLAPSDGDSAICIFDPAGEPRAQIDTPGIPLYRLGFDGRNAYVPLNGRILIFGDDESPPRSFTPPATDGRNTLWSVALSADGRELLVWERGSTRIHRYATPGAATP